MHVKIIIIIQLMPQTKFAISTYPIILCVLGGGTSCKRAKVRDCLCLLGTVYQWVKVTSAAPQFVWTEEINKEAFTSIGFPKIRRLERNGYNIYEGKISNPRRALICVQSILLVENDPWTQPVPHTYHLYLLTAKARALQREIHVQLEMLALKLTINQKQNES